MSIYFSQSLICNRVFCWSKWFNFVGGAKLLWIYSLSKVCQIGPQIGYSISNYWTSTRGGSFTSPLPVEMMTHLAPLKSEWGWVGVGRIGCWWLWDGYSLNTSSAHLKLWIQCAKQISKWKIQLSMWFWTPAPCCLFDTALLFAPWGALKIPHPTHRSNPTQTVHL